MCTQDGWDVTYPVLVVDIRNTVEKNSETTKLLMIKPYLTYI